MGSTTKGKRRKEPKRDNPPVAAPSPAPAVPPAERLGVMLEVAYANSVAALEEIVREASSPVVFRRDSLSDPSPYPQPRRWNGHPVQRPFPGDTLLSDHDGGVATVVTEGIARALHIPPSQIRFRYESARDAYIITAARHSRTANVEVAYRVVSACNSINGAEHLGRQLAYRLQRHLLDSTTELAHEPEPEPLAPLDPWALAKGCTPITDARQIVGEWISARPDLDDADEVRVELKQEIGGLIATTAVPELDRAHPLPTWASGLCGFLSLDRGTLRLTQETFGVQLGRGLLYFATWLDDQSLILARPGVAELLVGRAWQQLQAGEIVLPVLPAETERPQRFAYTMAADIRIHPSYFDP
jgi:hypothetical protein